MLLQEVEYLHSQWPPPLLDDDYSAIKTKDVPHILPGGVKLTVPSLHHLYLLHLYLGTATHIYIRLNDDNLAGGIKLPPLFRARGFAELQRKIEDLIVSQRWDEWLLPKNNNNNDDDDDRPDDGKECKVQVHVTTSKSKLMHTKAIEERVKQSIQQVFSNVATDNTTESDAKPMSRIRLMIRIDRDVVQLSLDTSQTPLHRRGYRLKPHKAPLREDLAYALLMSGGLMPNWDLRPQFYCSKSSPHRSSERTNHRLLTLYDPFCGSGTIAIEGACLQLGLPPGRFLPPPFDGTTFCNPALWEEMKSKALSVLSSAPQDSLRVAAGDIDQKAIDAAEANAKRAGVYKWMDFRKISFVLHPLLKDMKNGQKSQGSNDSSPSLLVVTNPPYGIRSPDETKNTIYRKLAKVLSSSSRRIDCAIIGKNIRAMRESGMPLEVIFSTKHGGLNVVAMSGRVTP
jgi:putative N6-adenine-specific DNA methylase